MVYQHRLRDANAADFGDLLLWPVRAMLQDRTWPERTKRADLTDGTVSNPGENKPGKTSRPWTSRFPCLRPVGASINARKTPQV